MLNRGSFKFLKKIWNLSLSIAKAEFKLRNEGSYLGIFWYLLNPILMFSLILLIFLPRLGRNIPEYPLYLLLGIIMFNFFQNTTINSTKTLIKDNIGIIKSINFSRESLVGAIVIKNLYSHFFEMILFFLFLIFFNISLIGIVSYLFILFFFSMFIFGSCLILSSLTVYFVDLENIWNFASRLIWFTTPIFYAIEGQTRLFYLNLFNPIFYFISIARELIIYTKVPELWMMLGGIGYSLLFLLIGLLTFNKLKAKFAEMI